MCVGRSLFCTDQPWWPHHSHPDTYWRRLQTRTTSVHCSYLGNVYNRYSNYVSLFSPLRTAAADIVLSNLFPFFVGLVRCYRRRERCDIVMNEPHRPIWQREKFTKAPSVPMFEYRDVSLRDSLQRGRSLPAGSARPRPI